MRYRLALLALSVAGAATAGGEATACIYNPITRLGPPPSARELADERASHERALRGQRFERARAAIAGGAEPAGLLAEMLVPNIRPIRIHRSDCGPENEIDPAPGEETPEDWLRGTRLAGRADEFPMISRMDGDGMLGPTCNAEFRGRFAAYLRHRLTATQLRDSYVFLGSYWDPPIGPRALRHRLTMFAVGTRRPPVLWHADSRQQQQEIRRWTRLVPTGRALKGAMDDFWRETEPLLGDPARACPQAAAGWPAEQARLVDELEGR